MTIFNGVTAPTVRVEYDAALPLAIKDPVDCEWTVIPTDLVRGISIRRGKSIENQLVQPGEATIILDNRSGDFDPMNDASPYWISLIPPFGGYSYFNANLGIRIIATWNEVDYVLYTGFLEQLNMDYGLNPTVTITCVDAMAWIAKQEIAAVPAEDPPGTPNPAIGNGDQVWFRCDRILDEISFPAGLRGLDTSVDNTLYGTRYGQDALSLLQTTANCNPARLFVDGDGLLRLMWWDGGDDAGLLLSDDPTNPDAVGYDSISVDPGSKYLINWVTINKIDGDGNTTGVAVSVDGDSELRFGPAHATYDLPTNTAAPVADALAYQYSEPFDRVREIWFSMANLGTNFPKVLVTDIPDVLTVDRTTYDGRALTFACTVEGLTHDITPDAWRMTYVCSTGSVVSTNYFFSALTHSYKQVRGISMTTVGTDVYVVGEGVSPATNTYAGFVAKFSSNGALAWQRTVAEEDIASQFYGVTSDGTNIYVVGATYYPGEALICALDSTGTLLWQRRFDTSNTFANKVVAHPSGGIVVAGGGDLSLLRYGADGSLIWQRKGDGWYYGVALDSSDNIIAVGGYAATGTNEPALITKVSSSGTQLWQRQLSRSDGANNYVSFTAAVCGPDDSIYVVGYADTEAYATKGVIAKYDSSGTLLWQRVISSDVWCYVNNLVIHNDKLYFAGTENTFIGYIKAMVGCYDLDGVKQWINCFTSNMFDNADDVAVDSSGRLLVTGITEVFNSGFNLLYMRVPVSGSGTGTYIWSGHPVNYTTSTVTDGAGFLADAAGSAPLSVSTLTQSADTPVVSTTDYTQETLYL